jgi:hypothetical protein
MVLADTPLRICNHLAVTEMGSAPVSLPCVLVIENLLLYTERFQVHPYPFGDWLIVYMIEDLLDCHGCQKL